jgi:hypothetical protein
MESRMRRKAHVRFGERVGGNDQSQDRHRTSDPTPRNPEPSRADIKITRQIASAGEVMGIPLHDHLIIAGTSHTSLAERGVIT